MKAFLEGLHSPSGAISSAQEVRFLRIELDLSRVNLAGLLGVSESRVRNWENGRLTIGKATESLLRALYYEHALGCPEARELIDRGCKLVRDLNVTALEL